MNLVLLASCHPFTDPRITNRSLFIFSAMSQFLTPSFLEIGVVTYAISLLVVYIVFVAIRRRYFSAISDIPGPFLASFSSLWEIWEIIAGHVEVTVIALHEKHGEVP